MTISQTAWNILTASQRPVRGSFANHFWFGACLCDTTGSALHPRICCRCSCLLTYLDPLLQLVGPWCCFLRVICCSVFGPVPWSSVESVPLPSPAPGSLTQLVPAYCVSLSSVRMWSAISVYLLCVSPGVGVRKPNCCSELFNKMKKLKSLFIHSLCIHSLSIVCQALRTLR